MVAKRPKHEAKHQDSLLQREALAREHFRSERDNTCTARRRRPRICLVITLVAFASSACCEAFLFQQNALLPLNHQRLKNKPSTSYSASSVTSKDFTETPTTSWSKSTSQSSRFGVRRRVRAVLEKAKNRTGVANLNSDAAVVSQTASLGGWMEQADLVLPNEASSVGPTTTTSPTRSSRNSTDINLIMGQATLQKAQSPTKPTAVDVNAVLKSGAVEPLPFSTPTLTDAQKKILLNGERVQEQSKMGREGSGFVVLDVKAPDYIVWECLLDFEKYPENIGTVRSMRMFTNTHLKQSYVAESPVDSLTRHYGTASITRASFVLSKFKLNIAAVHKYRPHPDGHYMDFTLDKACRNMVLKDAKGIWYTESDPDGRTGYTRVWLLCELTVSPVLPSFIVDYTAKRAMPRASNWIVPAVERKKRDLSRN